MTSQGEMLFEISMGNETEAKACEIRSNNCIDTIQNQERFKVIFHPWRRTYIPKTQSGLSVLELVNFYIFYI